jgi:prepilin-type N-terminal cleavage/methylation domain-containing protein
MKKAFTLIELIIVVVILGILALIALPRYAQLVERSRSAEAFGTMNRLRDVERLYYVVNGEFYAIASDANFPLNVDPDQNWPGDEVTFNNPNSPNFKYTVKTEVGSRRIRAQKVTGINDYYMCLENGATGVNIIPDGCNR